MDMEQARGLAAQAWTSAKNSNKIMDPNLAEEFAEILLKNEAAVDARCANKLRSIPAESVLRVRNCIGLLSSMVDGGESHSDQSRREMDEVLAALDGDKPFGDPVGQETLLPEPPDPEKIKALKREFEHGINRHSRENVSDTPDFILAEFMFECLEAFERASRAREKWYGKRLSIEGVKEVENGVG